MNDYHNPKPLVLDRRLALIAELVEPGASLADIGTDHGRLIAHLAATGQICRGYACDINQKPLDKARLLIAQMGLQDKVTAIRCDGLEGITPEMADHIVIAGMGGELIARIIGDWPYRCHPGVRYLLSPMTRPEALRGFLYAEGFEIERELCVQEGRFVYSVMSVVYTGQPVQPDDRMLFTGAIKLGECPDNLSYLLNLIGRLQIKAAGLETAKQDATRWYRLLEELRGMISSAD